MRTGVLCLIFAVALVSIVVGSSGAADVGSIRVRGQTIQLGDTADRVFGILTKEEMISQDVCPDPKNPNSLLIVKRFKVDGQSYTMAFARLEDPGPYVVTKITVDIPVGAEASGKLSIAAFESSAFLKKYKPSSKDKWTLKSGGVNYSYRFPDQENPYSSMGVELSSDAKDIRQLGIEWIGSSILKPARFTSKKEEFLREFLAAALPGVSADSVVAYVRSEGKKSYDGGGNAMPRKDIGGIMTHAGISASSLIVGLEK